MRGFVQTAMSCKRHIPKFALEGTGKIHISPNTRITVMPDVQIRRLRTWTTMQRLRTRQSHNSHSNSPILPLPQLLRNQSAFRYGVVSITSHYKTVGRPPLSFHVEVAAFLESTAVCHSTPMQLNCQVQIN